MVGASNMHRRVSEISGMMELELSFIPVQLDHHNFSWGSFTGFLYILALLLTVVISN